MDAVRAAGCHGAASWEPFPAICNFTNYSSPSPCCCSHIPGTSHWQLKNLFSLTISTHPHSLQHITLQISFSLSSNSFIYTAIFKSTKIKMFRIQFPFWFYKMELQLAGNTKLCIAGFSAHWLKCKSCTTQGHFIPQAGDLSFYYKMFHFHTYWKWSSSLWSSKDSKLLNLITYYLNPNRVHHFCESEMT